MTWRLRRSLKLAPGLRVNITKQGLSSISIGRRGATLNLGKQGVRQTVGIPGTGLSFSSSSKYTGGDSPARAIHTVSSTQQLPRLDPARFNLTPDTVPQSAGRAKVLTLAAGLGLLLVSIPVDAPLPGVIGGCLLLLGWLIPSRKSKEAAAARHCQQLAEAELARRITSFREAVDGLGSGSDVQLTLALQRELGLSDEEAGANVVDRLHAHVALQEYDADVQRNNGSLPIVEGHVSIVSPDLCYFSAACMYDKRGDNDPDGSLFLTDRRVVFLASEGLTATPWTKVITVERDGYELRVQRRDRQTPHVFVFQALADALRADYVATRLRATTSPSRGGVPTAGNRPTDVSPRGAVDVPADEGTPPASNTSASHGPPIDVGTGRGFTVGIVGESYRQTALRVLAGDRRRLGQEVRFTAVLIPEPTNSYDSNAVRVDIDGGAHVGYLSREDAVAYGAVLKAIAVKGAIATCAATLIGGTDTKPSLGVMLDLKAPDELLAVLSNGQPF